MSFDNTRTWSAKCSKCHYTLQTWVDSEGFKTEQAYRKCEKSQPSAFTASFGNCPGCLINKITHPAPTYWTDSIPKSGSKLLPMKKPTAKPSEPAGHPEGKGTHIATRGYGICLLAPPCPANALSFNKAEKLQFAKVIAQRQKDNSDCCEEIFVGMFFDGTGNNARKKWNGSNGARPAGYVAGDEADDSDSNVYRLFQAFPDKKGFRPFYIEGVGTPLLEIGDSGAGEGYTSDYTLGMGTGYLGERRIVWGLLNTINLIHLHFIGSPLLSLLELKTLSKELTEQTERKWYNYMTGPIGGILEEQRRLKRARKEINPKREAKLKELCTTLDAAVKPYLTKRPRPLRIRMSVFGFSRGSAQARAFTTWFVDMCKYSSSDGSMMLAGLPVEFDFLGIFDTVASVGLAAASQLAEGHLSWADAEHTLRVPGEVKRCVHMVAGHEIRRSFPSDSITVAGALNEDWDEFVYPGQHSDIGGSYAPKFQGRGLDANGADKLSRVPLAHMYREARLAGVPLDKNDPAAAARAKTVLKVDAVLIKAFNAYLDKCPTKKGPLKDLWWSSNFGQFNRFFSCRFTLESVG